MSLDNVTSDPSIPGWLQLLIVVLSLLLGGGGLAAILKVRSDRKSGIETHEVVEDDAIVARWKELSDAQIKMLLEPLKVRLSEVEVELTELKRDLGHSRKKYWAAIPYVRTLLMLMRHHAPDAEIPAIPSLIAEDI